MKLTFKPWALFLLACIATGSFWPNQSQARPGDGMSIQVFYNNLAPYGRWVNDREYGQIWLPDAGPGFQPYGTSGRWVQTAYGNTWVSDYPWGWATFHYGRWFFDDYYGWAWVPDNEWGPAWVSWRSGGGYYGWAPLPPRFYRRELPYSRWVFVPNRYICNEQVYRYNLPRQRVVNIYNNTTIINNTYVYNNRRYQSGPGRNEIERATNQRVRVYDVNNAGRPVRESLANNSVSTYRPQVSDRSNTGRNDSGSQYGDRDNRTGYGNQNNDRDRDRGASSPTERKPVINDNGRPADISPNTSAPDRQRPSRDGNGSTENVNSGWQNRTGDRTPREQQLADETNRQRIQAEARERQVMQQREPESQRSMPRQSQTEQRRPEADARPGRQNTQAAERPQPAAQSGDSSRGRPSRD